MAANHLHFPGVVGNYSFVPDDATLDGSGTLVFIAKVALDVWTPDADQVWISKWTGSAGYLFFLDSPSHVPYLIWNEGTISRVAIATVTPTVTDGDWLWVMAVATEDGVDRDVFFYTSTDETNNPDEVTWTQLGAEVVVPFGAGDLTTNTARVFVGAQSNTAKTMAGSIAAARVNFAGVTQLDIDFTDLTVAEVDAGSFTEDSGNVATVTIAGTAWAYVWLATVENFIQQSVRYWLGNDTGLDRESKLTHVGADHARWRFRGTHSVDGHQVQMMVIERPATLNPSLATTTQAASDAQQHVNNNPTGDPGTPPGRRGSA